MNGLLAHKILNILIAFDLLGYFRKGNHGLAVLLDPVWQPVNLLFFSDAPYIFID